MFIGNEFSVAAGLSNWYDLIGDLARNIEYTLPPQEYATKDTFIDAIEEYIAEQGLHSLS